MIIILTAYYGKIINASEALTMNILTGPSLATLGPRTQTQTRQTLGLTCTSQIHTHTHTHTSEPGTFHQQPGDHSTSPNDRRLRTAHNTGLPNPWVLLNNYTLQHLINLIQNTHTHTRNKISLEQVWRLKASGNVTQLRRSRLVTNEAQAPFQFSLIHSHTSRLPHKHTFNSPLGPGSYRSALHEAGRRGQELHCCLCHSIRLSVSEHTLLLLSTSFGFDALRWGSRPLSSSLSSFYLSLRLPVLCRRCLTRLPPSPTCPFLPSASAHFETLASFRKNKIPRPPQRAASGSTAAATGRMTVWLIVAFSIQYCAFNNQNQSTFVFGKDGWRNFNGFQAMLTRVN